VIAARCTSLLAVACMLSGDAFQGAPQPPWGLGPNSVIPINVPAAVRSAVTDFEYDETDSIRGVVVDLNRDGFVDYLIASAPSLCGTGGCTYAVVEGATERAMGQFFGSALYVRAEMAHGYPVIGALGYVAGSSANYTTYTFNGTAFVVTSTRLVTGASLDRLLATLRRIPMWRPRPGANRSVRIPTSAAMFSCRAAAPVRPG